MKKVVAIFFFFIFTISAVPAQELLKMPSLVAHFAKHKSDAPGMSFLHFISLHYFQHHTHENDPQQHKRLPFQSPPVANVVHLLHLPEAVITSLRPPACFVSKKITIDAQPLHLSQFISVIWQPPRFLA